MGSVGTTHVMVMEGAISHLSPAKPGWHWHTPAKQHGAESNPTMEALHLCCPGPGRSRAPCRCRARKGRTPPGRSCGPAGAWAGRRRRTRAAPSSRRPRTARRESGSRCRSRESTRPNCKVKHSDGHEEGRSARSIELTVQLPSAPRHRRWRRGEQSRRCPGS